MWQLGFINKNWWLRRRCGFFGSACTFTEVMFMTCFHTHTPSPTHKSVQVTFLCFSCINNLLPPPRDVSSSPDSLVFASASSSTLPPWNNYHTKLFRLSASVSRHNQSSVVFPWSFYAIISFIYCRNGFKNCQYELYRVQQLSFRGDTESPKTLIVRGREWGIISFWIVPDPLAAIILFYYDRIALR